jgi:hypothetical protein
MVSDNEFCDAGRMGRSQFLQTGNADGHKFARQFDLRSPAGAEYQIAYFVGRPQHFPQDRNEIQWWWSGSLIVRGDWLFATHFHSGTFARFARQNPR